MSYSTSERSFNRVKSLLDQMLSATTDLTWPSENAHMLGYHIREGIKIAKLRKITPYNELSEKFIIRNKGNRVVAELREFTPITALQVVMAKVTLPGIVSLIEILGGLIEQKNAEEVFFPDADMNKDELEKLYSWSIINERFIVAGDAGITVTKNDPGEARWSPE